ncbi:apoptosis-associated speck-like protein containing a CARD isoform 1-T2 [Leptodactylus fuscus]|uniref:apoptosis-associated speck-like protein containing a CARD isoform X1 n=1 Tax=Leptodactylus fuscus TaxID=238119 RepID=UPI003F4E569B
MGKTVRDVLLRALKSLRETAFKEFKFKLEDLDVKEGFSKIPGGMLEKAEHVDVARLIIQNYTESYGIEVTLTVLEAINAREEAAKLMDALKTVDGYTFQEPSSEAGASYRAPVQETAQEATSRDEKHFVDRHRAALIEDVPLVPPILDDLFQDDLLTKQAYNKIYRKSTSEEQMRELYTFVNTWRDKDKDQLLKSLRKHHAPLIKKLESK